MLIKWLLWAVVWIFSPAYVVSKDVVRDKLSDDFIPCDKGWYAFRDKCYRVGGRKKSERLSWDNAASRCTKVGGNLLTIQSKEELDFIISFLLLDIRASVWIGLHDRQNESIYTWNDGSVVNFTYWRELEPTGLKDESEDCTEMVFDPARQKIGVWNDVPCHSQLAYICQMSTNMKKKSPNPRYCSSETSGGWRFLNSCFHVVTEMKTWKNAEQHCQDNYRGHLVTILDTTVDLFLDHILSNINKELWIGIRIQDQFQQKWTSGWFVSYNGINKDQGDYIEGTCVLRHKRKVWSMAPCSKKYSFVCETSKVSPPTLKPPIKGSYCPEEPEDWRDLGGAFCYYIETDKSLNWYEANFDCIRRGGNLLSLHSKEETDVLHPFVRFTQEKIHIGLFRLLAHEDVFVWSDNSIVGYENWSHDEPNNEDEKCGEVWTHDMKWNDENCDYKKGYICYVSKIIPNITTTESIDCTGHVSFKALIGVSVCIFLVVILLGIVVYYFRPWDFERRKPSTTPVPPPSPSTNRPRYRSATEIIVKDDDYYEDMQ